MAEEHNNNQHFKCPHCACIFLTQADLQKHMAHFGDAKGEHEYQYRKVHGRIEYGSGEE